jgi:predicted thioesterase
MDITLQTGLWAEKTETVTEDNTAQSWGSGGLPVYATPAMIALMEMAAAAAVQGALPEGWSTVGTRLDVRHLSASPPAMRVRARAELIAVDGRALNFRVEAFDEAGKIGEGTHGRFIVEDRPFVKKAMEKAGKSPPR